MKKTYLIVAALALSLFGFSQTQTDAYSYGWAGEIEYETLAEPIVMEGYDQEAIDLEDIQNDQRKDIPWRFGYKYDTNISLESDGRWTDVEGGRLWNAVVTCPGALTVNLLMTDFFLPEGATLFLYDYERSNKIGAYTSRNNRVERELGTELIHGETMIIEYFEPTAVAGEGSFTISNVIHGYRSLSTVQKELEKGLNDSGACNVDVNCPLGEGWEDEIRSVAMIVVGGNGICSGAMINNTCEDARPLFLTANHCLGGSTASWSFRFNWESPDGTESCAEFGGSTDPGSPYDQTANGATVLESASASDYALLEIDNITEEEIFEWNVHFAGWDRSDEETVTESTGIHHPSGDLKKICRDDNNPYHDFTGGAQVWWIDDWDEGVTEPGSSGSPLFDQNHRIIGQLYGGAAACSGTDDNDAYDFYGRMGVSWVNGASEHLAPDACVFGDVPDFIDGFDPDDECPISLSTTIEEEDCFGEGNGSINIVATGGVAPYTYDIGDGPVASGSFTDLETGIYDITIIDDIGCVEEITITLSGPGSISTFTSSSPELEGSDGSINLSVSGGTSPYEYSWTGPDGFSSTEEDLTGLVSGLYTLTITDANGCTTEIEVVVESALSVSQEGIRISIYPNPSTGLYYIDAEGLPINEITVTDLSGRRVYAQTLNNSEGRIPVEISHVANGTYIVEMTTDTGVISQRIVKK